MSGAGEELVRRCRPLLGTLVEVAVSPHHAAAIDAAFAAVARVHAAMSFHEEASDLGRLRRAPAGTAVTVDAGTVQVLRLAARLHARSGGLFDVTVARALVADGFLPRPAGIDLRRCRGGADDIEILDDCHVRCRRPLLIDLGGIAKGHAVDRAVDALAAAGVAEGIVNAGGDLRVLGPTPHAIHLQGLDGAIEGAVTLADGALASSGHRRERRQVRGRWAVPQRARDGASLALDRAVAVAAPTCAVADAMTKVALADRALAAAMLDEFGGAIVDPATRPPAA